MTIFSHLKKNPNQAAKPPHLSGGPGTQSHLSGPESFPDLRCWSAQWRLPGLHTAPPRNRSWHCFLFSILSCKLFKWLAQRMVGENAKTNIPKVLKRKFQKKTKWREVIPTNMWETFRKCVSCVSLSLWFPKSLLFFFFNMWLPHSEVVSWPCHWTLAAALSNLKVLIIGN